MSVRRLAEDHLQPEGFKFKPAFGPQVKDWLKKYPKGREQSAVIPLLMLAQEQEGWVTKAAIEHVAGMLDMPRIRVLEVATFYTQFQLKPVGTRAHVQVCGTTPCMLRGAEDLKKVCQNRIHHDQFTTNEAGTLSWEEVECLGACVNAPMVMIFKDTYEDLTPERLEEIIDAFETGKGDSIAPGPQNGRTYSAPMGKQTTLTDEAAIMRGKPATRGKASSAQAPTKAAKPKTYAPEGDRALKKPGAAKAAGASANPTAKLASTAAAVKPKAKPKAAVSSGNPTMKLAATASGAAKPAKATGAGKDRPKGIAKPKTPDDLKMISGVGPKIEGILHSLGIYTFAQVAAWKKAERDWVDDYLKFKGRIEREDWVKQAKALAKGGRDEYVRVFGKEPR